MSEGAGNRIPKTLADVSHLFFSKVEESATPAPSNERAGSGRQPERPGAPGGSAAAPRSAARVERPRRAERTCVIVVTGGEDAPGKSTVAVNLAQGLLPWGSVGLFDADPRLPNARFYRGLPSWHYLSPVTGGGKAAPTTALESGLVVVDWTPAATDASAVACAGGSVHVDVEGGGRQRLDYAVVDLAPSRLELLRDCGERVGRYVVVAAPGWDGFRSACECAARLGVVLGVRAVDLVVNRAPDGTYAGAYHRKFNMATRDLMSIETRLLAGVALCPSLGSEQRERGPIVRSRPDAAPALALRNAASAIAGTESASERTGASCAPRTENPREDQNPEIGSP